MHELGEESNQHSTTPPLPHSSVCHSRLCPWLALGIRLCVEHSRLYTGLPTSKLSPPLMRRELGPWIQFLLPCPTRTQQSIPLPQVALHPEQADTRLKPKKGRLEVGGGREPWTGGGGGVGRSKHIIGVMYRRIIYNIQHTMTVTSSHLIRVASWGVVGGAGGVGRG